jgi:hypothetical protein
MASSKLKSWQLKFKRSRIKLHSLLNSIAPYPHAIPNPPAGAAQRLCPAEVLSKPVFNSAIKASDVRALLVRSESHLHNIKSWFVTSLAACFSWFILFARAKE